MDLTLAAPPTGPFLTINADDFGVCAARDRGILQLFARGRIDAATLLVNGESSAAAGRAGASAGLPLGLHLNLTEGRALAPGANSLTDTGGALRGKFGLRAALAAGEVDRADLAREIRAQLDAFAALTGGLPTHVDGHHHIHVAPAVAGVLASILDEEYGVPVVRLPLAGDAALADAARPADGGPADFYRQVVAEAQAARATFAACGLRWADAFLGLSLMGERLTAGGVAASLAALRARGVSRVELMVHPGEIAAADEGNDFSREAGRAHELAILDSPAFAQATAGWQRTSPADFAAPPTADNRPTVILVSKLAPATGNAETVRRLRAAWAPLARTRVRPLLADPGDAAALARDARALAREALREGADFAFGVHAYRAGALLAAAFGRQAVTAATGPADAPLPFALLASGTDANDDVAVPARRATMADALGQASFLLCLTDALRARLAELPLPADTRVCANGIAVDTASRYSLRAALGLADDQPLILFPAAIRPVKGVLPLLETLLPELAVRHPNHVLAVVGPTLDAPYRARVDACIADALARWPQLAGRLHLHPGLPHADYLAALREAALVINHSTSEGQSHALLEAMAAGVPVLASDIPGNRNVVRDGATGRLFSDAAALRTAYAACFADTAATRAMVNAARREVSTRFSPQGERATLADALRAALDRHQTPLALPGGRAVRLDLAATTHRVDPHNLPLFAALAPAPALLARLRTSPGLAVDVGAGSGVFGLHLAAQLVEAGVQLDSLCFADVDVASLQALQRTLLRHGSAIGGAARWRLVAGSLLDPLLRTGRRADLICANLPQTPAPGGLGAQPGDPHRNPVSAQGNPQPGPGPGPSPQSNPLIARLGGSDGADLVCALLGQLPAALAPDGEAWLLHIGLANPQRVAAAADAAGLVLQTVASRPRRVSIADYAALAPGLPDHLRDCRAAGGSEFVEDGDAFCFEARLLRVTHR